MPTLNYTTKVAAGKTVGEVHQMLVKHGASAIITNYENQQPVGISFRLPTPHDVRDFSLPVHAENVQRVLAAQYRDGAIRSTYATEDQAARTAWRVLKDWLEAQLAIIEAELMSFDQVMLPYMQMGELTVYDAYVQSESSLRELTA